MARRNATPERDDLLRVLDELGSLLRAWDEDRWADWIERDRRLIANGHAIAEDRVRPVNDRLRTLRGAAFTMATKLRDDEHLAL